MVHSEVYLNKYAVSIAPFSTPACPDCSQNCSFLHVFAFYFFIHFFRRGGMGSADPICPYVRTAMHAAVARFDPRDALTVPVL